MRTRKLILTLFLTLFTAGALLAVVSAGTTVATAKKHGKQSKKARVADRNRDRIPDRWERHFRLSLKVNQAKLDQDRDSLNNLAEFQTGHNPRDEDSDDDGIDDGAEDTGKIVSFESGVLTISLASGVELTGTVDDQTEIECKTVLAPPATSGKAFASHDQPGSGGGHQGDDQSGDGQGVPTGDDSGDDNPSGGDHGSGDDSSGPGGGDGPGDDNNNGDHCSTADLTPGTLVHEAEASIGPNGLLFKKLELRLIEQAPAAL